VARAFGELSRAACCPEPPNKSYAQFHTQRSAGSGARKESNGQYITAKPQSAQRNAEPSRISLDNPFPFAALCVLCGFAVNLHFSFQRFSFFFFSFSAFSYGDSTPISETR
jgi:hypothetical protein